MSADLIAIVPSAGHARRLHPLTGSKELISVNGAPIMAHLLGRMAQLVSPERVLVVTRPDKTDVSDYARSSGHRVVTGRPRTVAESLMLGLTAADEVWGANPDRIVLFGFPDTLFAPADAYARLTAELEGGTADVVLGLFHFADPSRADVVELNGRRVQSVQPKPPNPVSDLVWGIGVARRRALDGLTEVTEPGDLFGRLAQEGRVAGVDLGADYLDIGVPDILRQVLRAAPDW